RLGSGPAEFKTPHDIAMDADGRLLVADRGNHRIQILEQDGRFIAEWKQFGRPSGVYLRDGLIYVAASESNGVAPNPGRLRGLRASGGSYQGFLRSATGCGSATMVVRGRRSAATL